MVTALAADIARPEQAPRNAFRDPFSSTTDETVDHQSALDRRYRAVDAWIAGVQKSNHRQQQQTGVL